MNKKVSVKNPFCSGDYVVYPAHGVGKVQDITKQKIAGSELELIVVNFDKDKMTLRIPMAKAETTGLRRISEAGTMADALNTLKGKARVKKVMWSRRAQEYENKINSGSPVAIAEVIRDLYRSENLAEQSYSERQIYEQALDRLANEYAVFENISSEAATKKLKQPKILGCFFYVYNFGDNKDSACESFLAYLLLNYKKSTKGENGQVCLPSGERVR